VSDSIANLEIKVNIASVKGAMQALDGLVAKADSVEKRQTKAAEDGGKKRISAQERELRNAEKVAKQQRQLLFNQERAEIQAIVRMARMRQKSLTDQTRDVERATKEQARAYELVQRQRLRNQKKEEQEHRQFVNRQIALERALQNSQSRFTGIQGRANRQLPTYEASQVISQARKDLTQYQAVIRQFGVGSVEATRAHGVFTRSTQTASGEIARQGGLLRTLNDNARTTAAAFGAANSSMGGFGRLVFSTNAALQALVGTLALREITQSIMEFERFTNTLRTVSGSAGQFASDLNFLFNEANRIGFSVGEVGNSFARLSLAMQGAGFTTEQTRDAFTQLSEASRNFGLSSADTMGIMRALEQSMSKGKFMAEEIRNQMGDRLPIAMAALQRAVNEVDGAQVDLNKRFEEGTLDVARYAEEFIRQINIMSGGAETLSRTSNTMAASFGRLGTEFSRTTAELGESGFSNAVIIATENLRRLLEFARESGVVDALGTAFEVAATHINTFAAAIIALSSLAIVRLLVSFAAFIPQLRLIHAGFLAVSAGAVLVGSSTDVAGRAMDRFRSSAADTSRAVDKVKQESENFQTILERGFAITGSAATETDKLITVYTRLGDSFEVAARKAAQSSLVIMEAQANIARSRLREAEAALPQLYGAMSPSFRNLSGADSMLQRGLRSQQEAFRPNPEAIAATQSRLDNLQSVLAPIRAVINGLTTAEDAARQLREQFGGPNGLPENIRDLVPSVAALAEELSKASVNGDFNTAIVTAVTLRTEVAALASQIATMRGYAGDAPLPNPNDTIPLPPPNAPAVPGANNDRGGRGAQNAVKEFLDDLERVANRSPVAAGATREVADAQDRLRDAARNAGQQVNIENDLLRVQELTLRRLAREMEEVLSQNERTIADNNRIADGYFQSSEAGRQAELSVRAYAEATKYAIPGTQEHAVALEKFVRVLGRVERSERLLAAGRQTAQNNDEIAVLERERELVTATVEQREIEIALLRARQQYGAAFTPELEVSIRALGVARSRTEQVRNSWDELARSGERAFETIGDAITEAFAKGEISSIRFGDIARAVMSSVAQTALRMAVVNPILNGIFGGTRATLGGLVDAAGGGGGGGGGGMGFLGSIGQLSGLSNLLPGGGFSGIGASINSWGASAFPSIFSSGAPASIATAGGVSMPGAASAGSLFGGTTLMGALGGVGGGFALGSLLGGMVAGNSPARKTNSMIGSGAGALAGVGLAAAFGGPVGLLAAGLIGGAGGGLLGGLIGPKKGFSGGDAWVQLDERGMLRFDGAAGKGFDTSEIAQQTRQQADQINQTLQSLGLWFNGKDFKAQDQFGFGSVGGGESTGPRSLEEAFAKSGAFRRLSSNNSRVQTALNTVEISSFDNLVAVVQEATALSDVLDNIGKPSSEFNDAMKQLNANFDEYTRQAQRLGFGEAEIAAERKKQIDLMYSERQLRLQTISDEIKIRGWRLEGKDAMADELEASINRAQQIKALTQDLEQMGYTAEQIAPFVENYGNLIDRETKRVFSDLQNNIKDFLEGLRTSDLGGYSAPDRLASARQFYDRDLAAARGGDRGALEGLTGRAETLLNAARDNFASSFQWKAVRDYIQSTLGELSITKFAKGGIPDVVSEPHIASMAMFGEAGREAIVPLRRMSNGDLGVAMGGGNMQAVVAEIRGLREDNIALRQEVASMKKELVKTTLRTAEATEDTADSNRRMVTQAPRERVGARA
jgi:tape measure domain-containing protein